MDVRTLINSSFSSFRFLTTSFNFLISSYLFYFSFSRNFPYPSIFSLNFLLSLSNFASNSLISACASFNEHYNLFKLLLYYLVIFISFSLIRLFSNSNDNTLHSKFCIFALILYITSLLCCFLLC